MLSNKLIEFEQNNAVGTLWLNRPEVLNALNCDLLDELSAAIDFLNKEESIRIIIIKGRGNTFCSGADLNWLNNSKNQKEILEKANSLAKCFQTINNSEKPVITIVHGNVLGGANGLVCASDFSIAEDSSTFAFPEVRIGLVPSTISPYVINKIGIQNSRKLFLTAAKINVVEAKQIGLVDFYGNKNEVEDYLNKLVSDLLKASPKALAETKRLINAVSNQHFNSELINYTTHSFVKMKMGDESEEGISAFNEKRKPFWNLS